MERSSTVEPVLWKTAVAIPLALIVYFIASTLAAMVYGLVQSIMTNYSEGWITFMCQVIGGAMGIIGARWTCDKLLTPYSNHVIFMVFALLGITSIVIMYFALHIPPFSARSFYTLGSVGASLATAYYFFWIYEPLD